MLAFRAQGPLQRVWNRSLLLGFAIASSRSDGSCEAHNILTVVDIKTPLRFHEIPVHRLDGDSDLNEDRDLAGGMDDQMLAWMRPL